MHVTMGSCAFRRELANQGPGIAPNPGSHWTQVFDCFERTGHTADSALCSTQISGVLHRRGGAAAWRAAVSLTVQAREVRC